VKTGDQFKPDPGQTIFMPFLLLTDKLRKVQKPLLWDFDDPQLQP
jgi:hypothetical protein